MTASRDDIIQHINDLLAVHTYSDYGPNGLQVVGTESVATIATAVSSTLEVFRAAADAGADMLIVHHGLFWKNTPQPIGTQQRDRLATLFSADISLAAYHLPLDGHTTLGNNALIRAGLDLTPDSRPFAVINGAALGSVGTYPTPMHWPEFLAKVTHLVAGRTPLVLGAAPSHVSTVAICSGGAAGEISAAAELGADVFITGEPREDSHAMATELGCTLIAAGHYATETFGVRALGAHLSELFGVRHIPIDVVNPV